MNQKRDIYNDLLHALEVMRYVDDKTPQSTVYYAMWLLEKRSLGSGTNIHVSALQTIALHITHLTSF